MLMATHLAGFGVGGSSYLTNAVVFDGTNDYLTRGADYTSNGDAKTGIFSGWIRLNGGDGADGYLVQSAGGIFLVNRNASNVFHIEGYNAAASAILLASSTATYTAGATWRHLLLSWDLAAAALHLYVNDVSDLAGGSTVTDDAIDYTRTNHAVGATTAAGNKLNADVADLYLAFGQYLDFSSGANRRKFIDGSGKPVDLGLDGSAPTGVAPTLFLKGTVAGGFATNKGTGGGMSTTGTLTDSVGSPSD